MMSGLRSVLLVLLATVIVLGGCGAAYKRPEVRFEGMRLGGVGLRGGTFYAQLQVVNPNGFRLESSSLTYDFEVTDAARTADDGWMRLTSGTFDEPIRVGANDSADVEIPIPFEYAQLGGALQSIMNGGTVGYRVSGVVSLRQPVRRNVPYRHSGRVAVAIGR